MGTQMTKELGVYNEEEKVHTPPISQRYRLLNKDPRSATVGINRTPIHVECSPLPSNRENEAENSPKTASLVSGKIHDKVDFKNDVNSLNECEDNCSINELISSLPKDAKYLETDIDKVDSSEPSSENKISKSVIELIDVRSPTYQINRTPILVECTPELFALHSQIENLTFCDVEISEDEPSAVVSDDDQSSHHNQSAINNWLVRVENQSADTSMDKSFLESPRQVARKHKELNALKKQLFFTPNIKETTKPKVRTPLGDIQAGQLLESPQRLIRSKQWRNIEEERKRRGISDTENTPPSLPPLSKVSSAPGKMLQRKRNKICWDEDEAVLI